MLLDRLPTLSPPDIYNNNSEKVGFLSISKTSMLSEWQEKFAWHVFQEAFARGLLASQSTEVPGLLSNFATVSLVDALVSVRRSFRAQLYTERSLSSFAHVLL